MSDPKPKAKKSFGPESDFFQKLKGKSVCVRMKSGAYWLGRLLWVDRYSIGLLPEDSPGLLPRTTSETMLLKSGIDAIHGGGYECAPGDENANRTYPAAR